MGYTIWPDGPTGDALQAINTERHRQDQLVREGKFSWNCSAQGVPDAEKLAVLAEEFGEASKEVVEAIIELGKYQREQLEYPPHRAAHRKRELRKELIQVAAVCVAWIESLEEK